MLIEAEIRANLQLGHVIKLTFNKETGQVQFMQSKELLWVNNYKPFNSMLYHDMLDQPFDLFVIRDLKNTLLEKGFLYGCVLNCSKDAGKVYVTFHSDPIFLYNHAKISLEVKKKTLYKVIKGTWEKTRCDSKGYSYLRGFYPKCYCGRILDPDINERCPECTGYICVCGKCHCTEGKSFKQNQ